MYKKIFMGIAAVAALTLVSCSSDDLNSLSDNSSKNEAISFDGYLGRSAVSVNGSRGSELEIADLQASKDGFGVFGNYSSTGNTTAYGENLFKNEQVTYSTPSTSTNTNWTYKNTKYWPTEGHIDFLAYAPYGGETTLKNSKSIDFTVEKEVANQKDLLWANAEMQTKSDNPVKFTFYHALAKIGYTVKTSAPYDGTTITLKSITLAGSKDKTKEAFYTSGTIDLSQKNQAAGLWTNFEGKQNFTWFNGSQKVTSTSTGNPNTDYLFVIPQDFSKTTENADELFVIVEYTIQTGETAVMNSIVSSKLAKSFDQGKAYTINLSLGLTPIEFDVTTVEKWTDGNEEDIPLN